jgi:hypothetical protein
MSGQKPPSDAIRLRALEMALAAVIAQLPREDLEHAENYLAAIEAPAEPGPEREAAQVAGGFISEAMNWFYEADEHAEDYDPVGVDPEAVAAFEGELNRLIRVECGDGVSPDDLDRLADAIVAAPSRIATRGGMSYRSEVAEGLRRRAAQARDLS